MAPAVPAINGVAGLAGALADLRLHEIIRAVREANRLAAVQVVVGLRVFIQTPISTANFVPRALNAGRLDLCPIDDVLPPTHVDGVDITHRHHHLVLSKGLWLSWDRYQERPEGLSFRSPI